MFSKFTSVIFVVVLVVVIGLFRGYQSYYPQYDSGVWVITAKDGKIYTSYFDSVWSSPNNTARAEWVPTTRKLELEITMMTKDGTPVRTKLETEFKIPFKQDQNARIEEVAAMAELRQAIQQHYIDIVATNNYDYINQGAFKSCWGGPCFNTLDNKWIKETLFKVGAEWNGNVIIKEFTPAFQHNNSLAIDTK